MNPDKRFLKRNRDSRIERKICWLLFFTLSNHCSFINRTIQSMTLWMAVNRSALCTSTSTVMHRERLTAIHSVTLFSTFHFLKSFRKSKSSPFCKCRNCFCSRPKSYKSLRTLKKRRPSSNICSTRFHWKKKENRSSSQGLSLSFSLSHCKERKEKIRLQKDERTFFFSFVVLDCHSPLWGSGRRDFGYEWGGNLRSQKKRLWCILRKDSVLDEIKRNPWIQIRRNGHGCLHRSQEQNSKSRRPPGIQFLSLEVFGFNLIGRTRPETEEGAEKTITHISTRRKSGGKFWRN